MLSHIWKGGASFNAAGNNKGSLLLPQRAFARFRTCNRAVNCFSRVNRPLYSSKVRSSSPANFSGIDAACSCKSRPSEVSKISTTRSSDVNATGQSLHIVQMLLYGRFVERIDACRFGFPPTGSDFISHRFYLFQVASGQEDCGTFAGKGASNSTTNRSTSPIDHRMLIR